MNKKVIGAMGLVLTAGVVVSGASCWRLLRNGSFTDSVCTNGSYNPMDAFVPSYDYAELRETDGRAGAFRIIQTAGRRCGGEACEAALAAATSDKGWSNGSHGRLPGHQYIVAVRGENVQVVDGSVMRLGAALAPIDSPLKAGVVASFERTLALSCEPSVRKVSGGFEVHVSTDSCRGPRDEVIGVAINGETTVISAESSPHTCVGSLLNEAQIEPKYAADWCSVRAPCRNRRIVRAAAN